MVDPEIRSLQPPAPEDAAGRDYDSAGRVDGALLAGLVEDAEAQYFLCGPPRFLADLHTALEHRGVPPEHIHRESLGPVG